MALQDFKKYLISIQSQVIEMKSDLAEFDKALKDGYITEDKLVEVKDNINLIETNYQRLLYVAYLLELPKRIEKKRKLSNMTEPVKKALENIHADELSVYNENKSCLDELRQQLKLIKNN